jgi:TolB-like protein
MFKNSMKIFSSLVFLSFFSLHQLAFACTSTPDLSALNQSFLSYLSKQTGGKNSKIVVMPFFDNNVGDPDSLLYYGFPFFVYDAFASTKSRFVHPYVSIQAVKTLGISGKALYDMGSAKLVASQLKAQYVIYGVVQQSLNQAMRVVINIYDAKNNRSLDKAVSFTTEVNDSLFSLLKHHVKFALSQMRIRAHLIAASDSEPSWQAFRYYSKGLALSKGYDLASLEMAAIWFEKALKLRYQNYDDAALGLARTHFMIALIKKLNKQDYSQAWQEANHALGFVKQKRQKNKTPFKYMISYRYLEGQLSMTKALSAYAAKNYREAFLQAKIGLEYVPEDGVLQNLYQVTLLSNKPIKGIVINNPICL